MMRNKLILLLMLLPIMATAQIRFGYISYSDVCVQMPKYAEAQKQLAELKVKYDEEATRGEAEFQRKFTDFLQGQKGFPANILLKRQAELQELMDRGVAFRKECQELLQNAEQGMLKDLYEQMNTVIAEVALERGLAFVLNTDNNAAPFINTAMGEDITDYVRYKLGIIAEKPVMPEIGARMQTDPITRSFDTSDEQTSAPKAEQPATAESEAQSVEEQPAHAESQTEQPEQGAEQSEQSTEQNAQPADQDKQPEQPEQSESHDEPSTEQPA